MIGLDDDLDAIFDTADFGESVVFSTGGGLTVTAIFTGPTDATELYGVAVEAQKPTLICRTSRITAVRNGHTVVRSGTTYTVKNIQVVGQGCSVVELKTP